MSLPRSIIAAGSLALFAAGSFAQRVKTDYDHHVDFGQYKTFSFENVQTADPFWVDRIKTAVAANLKGKGWMPVNSGGDVAIIALEINETHQTLNTYYDAFGGIWSWKGGYTDFTTTIDTYEVGTLVVDLFDAKTKKLIWRGSSTESISNKPGKDTKALDRGVERMFDHFPVGSKK